MARRVVTVGLATALLLGGPTPLILASPQDDLAVASARIEELGAELEAAQDELARKTEELEATSYEIGEKESSIRSTQAELARMRSVLADRMRSSYKAGPVSMIEVLLGATSIDDLVSRIYFMDKVSAEDAATIGSVHELALQLSDERSALADKKAQQEAAVAVVEEEISSYEEKVAEAQEYYDQLDAEIKAQLAAQAAAEEERRRAAATALQAIQEAPTSDAGPASAAGVPSDGGQPAQESSSGGSDSSGDSGSSSGSSYAGAGVASAYSCIGKPYVWGATGPNSFDCSGLVCYCYGYAHGRSTYSMIDSLKASGRWKTSMSQLAYGDLVFPSTGHVGIYIGDGMMIHAPSPGRSVCVASVYSFIGGGSY